MPDTNLIGNAADFWRDRTESHAAFPAKNIAANPVRNYEIASREIARLMEELRKRRLEFLGIYHSHPHSMDGNEPSPKDIALAHSETIYFMVTRPYATVPIRHLRPAIGGRWGWKFRFCPNVNAQGVKGRCC